MITERVAEKRILRSAAKEAPRRRLEPPEIETLCYIGMRCNGGGLCVLPLRLRRAAAALVLLGLVHMWFRQELGVGLTRPFYSLTTRGQQLAGALLYARKNPSRSDQRHQKNGDQDVPTR